MYVYVYMYIYMYIYLGKGIGLFFVFSFIYYKTRYFHTVPFLFYGFKITVLFYGTQSVRYIAGKFEGHLRGRVEI
jgi:hypothetical protein